MQKLKLATTCTALITCGFIVTASAADVYKWTDSQGNTHYGKTPPRGSNAEEVSIAPPPAPDPNLQQRQESAYENYQQTQQKRKNIESEIEVTKEKQKVKDEIAELCKKYQHNLDLLSETGRRVYYVDAQGEYHWFNDEERAQRIEQIKANMQRYCTKKP